MFMWCEKDVLKKLIWKKHFFNLTQKSFQLKYAPTIPEGFPSGQRGQTVNLLAQPSVVRIHHPPPLFYSLRVSYIGYYLGLPSR